MTTAAKIRKLAEEGLEVKEIAARLGIRYQHAYGVLRRSTKGSEPKPRKSKGTAIPKPPLSVDDLTKCGFVLSGSWILRDAMVVADRPLPKDVGVYAFARGSVVLYVGVATMGLAKRLRFYSKPGAKQRTSQRINLLVKEELRTVQSIDVYTAIPADMEWNGLPVHGSAGLELGLIKKYALPWNIRSAK